LCGRIHFIRSLPSIISKTTTSKEAASLKPKVLISTSIQPDVLKALETLLSDVAEVRFVAPSLNHEFLNELEGAAALIPLNESIGEEMLNHAMKLKAVSRLGVGYDKVDIEACTKRSIYITHTPGVVSRAVAELTMGLMLCLSRKILISDRYVRSEWAKPDRIMLPLREDLAEKTLGIIGLGRIGQGVARRAKAFDMNLVYYDKVRNEKAENELGIRYLWLDDLLRESDFVSVHVPLTPETKGLIGARELRLMKKTAYLINTSRGQVVDEEALCHALDQSRIAGAGLDVYAKEPLPFDSPLSKMENVVLTPHMGTHTVETRSLMVLSAVDNIKKVLVGEVPPNVVPEQRGRTFEK